MLQEIKKTGNKINLLARKIEEAKKLELRNRIFDYFEELEKCQAKLNKLLTDLKNELCAED